MECGIFSRLRFERPILDIGCGDGLYCTMLFAEKIDTGIDPNLRELERARELGGYQELIQCFGASVNKADGTYRTIFSNSVLEHIPDLRPVLTEAFRLLATGGNFYFTVPSSNFERFTMINLALETLGLTAQSERFRAFFNRFWAHHHTYTLDGWIALGKEAGFELIEAHSYGSKHFCLLNATLTPLALPSKLVKVITNRWVLFPGVRRWLAEPIADLAGSILRGSERAEDGGLVFVALRKP